jgi:hypothetical protein
MMERVGTDAGVAARERGGQAFADAARTCVGCTQGKECKDWLDQGSGGDVPGFCPNGAYLNRARWPDLENDRVEEGD